MVSIVDNKFAYHKYLQIIADEDVKAVIPRDVSYDSSWKKRGGIGAFFTYARKPDRLEAILAKDFGYDLFEGIKADPSGKDGSILDQIRDMRRYLLLAEAECRWQMDNK